MIVDDEEISEKLGMPVGKKLKLTLLIPLVSGIVICSVFIIIAVFVSQADWIYNTQSYIKNEEEAFMFTLASSASNEIGSALSNVWYYVYFVSEIYEQVKTGQISANSSLNDPNIINAYTAFSQSYPNFDYSVWVNLSSSQDVSSIINDVKVPDAFMRSIVNSTSFNQQLGLLFDKSYFEYLYPLEDMSYVKNKFDYTQNCPNAYSYNILCSNAYAMLKNTTNNDNVTVYFENNQLFFLYRTDFGAGLAVLPTKFFLNKIRNTSDYEFFASEYLGH